MKNSALAALAIGLCFTFDTRCFAASYSAVILRTPTEEYGGGFGVNNLGQVVGATGDMEPPCLFVPGGVQLLGSKGGYAFDINDSGQIVGIIDTDHGLAPFLYSDGTMHELAYPGTFTRGNAYGINNRGDVVGEAYGFNDDFHLVVSGAFLFSDGVMQHLETGATAFDINDGGQIAGHFSNGFLYSHGTSVTPGTLPGALWYEGRAINEQGDIAGIVRFPEGNHGFVYLDGVMHDLGFGEAYGINESGVVLGVSMLNDYRPYLYRDGAVIYLDTLLDRRRGFSFQGVSAINDSGQITGTGGFPPDVGQAFLMTPVPEPSTRFLSIVGVVGIAFWRLTCGK